MCPASVSLSLRRLHSLPDARSSSKALRRSSRIAPTLRRSLRIVPAPPATGQQKSHLEVVAGTIAVADRLEHQQRRDVPPDSTGLYELQLAQTLPVVNISRTPASAFLPARAYQWFEGTMHRFTPILLTLFRISLVAFAGLLFVPSAIVTPWIPLILVISTLPPVFFASFFSIDILSLLPRYYEFWFISILNFLTWFGLGMIFGDLRAYTCFTLWFNFQTVVAIDANFRTFPAAVKPTMVAGPAMIALVVCCAYSLVVDSSYPTLYIGVIPFQSRQVVVFTASTIAVFMFKKAHSKRRRMRIRLHDRKNNPAPTPGRHTIPCVLILARVKLVLRDATPASVLVSNTTNNLSRAQHLQLAPTKALVVDATKILLPSHLLKWLISSCGKAVVYILGVMGLSATAISWFMILGQRCDSTSLLTVGVAAVAALCSLIFTCSAVVLAQRDLFRLLVWNFDVLFSTFQGTVLAVCLFDLSSWQASPCLAVVAWWLWLHYLLVLDAVTPSLTHQLRIRKYFGLPAVILVLCIAAGCAFELIVGDTAIFSPRLLWSIRVNHKASFDLHTSILAVQRTVTIVGWFPRLLVELATGNPEQLLFIRRQVEYFSPFVTFTDPIPAATAEAETQSRDRRRTRF